MRVYSFIEDLKGHVEFIPDQLLLCIQPESHIDPSEQLAGDWFNLVQTG